MPEPFLSESGSYDQTFLLSIIPILELRRGDIADRLEEPLSVEPGYPFEGRVLNNFQSLPPATPPDNLRLDKTSYCFSECVVICGAYASDRGCNAGFDKSLAMPYGKILTNTIAIMNKVALDLASPERLLQCIQRQVGVNGPRRTPPDDHPWVHVDDEGNVDESSPGCDVGKVGEPELVGPYCAEYSLNEVKATMIVY